MVQQLAIQFLYPNKWHVLTPNIVHAHNYLLNRELEHVFEEKDLLI